MRRRSWFVLGLVIGLSFTGAPLFLKRDRQCPNLVPVVVLAVDLPAGTEITHDHLSLRSIPEWLKTESMVTPDSANHIVGQRLLVELKAGDVLRWPDFGSDRLAVPKNGRAFTIALEPARMVSGQLARGDHVDVLVSLVDPQTNDRNARTLVQDVIVLGVAGTELIVLVSEQEAEQLMLAQDLGRFAIALRNPQDHAIDEWPGRISLNLLLHGGTQRIGRDQILAYPTP